MVQNIAGSSQLQECSYCSKSERGLAQLVLMGSCSSIINTTPIEELSTDYTCAAAGFYDRHSIALRQMILQPTTTFLIYVLALGHAMNLAVQWLEIWCAI